jgi:hypothetical protein
LEEIEMKALALVFATLVTGSIAGTANAEILLGRIKSAARLVCGLRNAGPTPIVVAAR